jgi:aldehyde dehydrogenase (NAD+)
LRRPLANSSLTALGAPRSGLTFESINPATEEVVGLVALADDADLDNAVAAARAAISGPWSKVSGLERGNVLVKFADDLEAAKEALARAQVLEMGKTITQSRFEIDYLVNLFRYHAGWASKLDGAVKNIPGELRCYVTHEPIGVVAAITPFNVPLYLMATKLAPALAAGYAFIHKPPTETSLSGQIFAEVVRRSGLPKGLYNLVTGRGSSVGRAIARHPGIDKIAFTGSTEVGIDITREAAATLKRVTMELGGKSPNIILSDADLEIATTNAVMGNFINSGQICTSCSRLIVERSVYNEVVDRVHAKIEAIVVGDPFDKNTFNGPVASKTAQDHIMGYIGKGKAERARLVTGGETFTLTARAGSSVRHSSSTQPTTSLLRAKRYSDPCLQSFPSRTLRTHWRSATLRPTVLLQSCIPATSERPSGRRRRFRPDLCG